MKTEILLMLVVETGCMMGIKIKLNIFMVVKFIWTHTVVSNTRFLKIRYLIATIPGNVVPHVINVFHAL